MRPWHGGEQGAEVDAEQPERGPDGADPMGSKISGAPAPLKPPEDRWESARPHTSGAHDTDVGAKHVYRLAGGTVSIRISPVERELIAEYADAESIPLGQAARRLIRLGLTAADSDPAAAPKGSRANQYDMLTEIGLLNMIIGEQVLQILETLSPYGQGADAFLVTAAQAAQRRLARGTGVEPAFTDDDTT